MCVWVVQLLVAATPLIPWLRVHSYDDHLVLNLVAQEHEKDSKLSSSLPHRCACCAKVPCEILHSVVSVQTVPHLFPLSSACSCASTSCRSSSHCVSWPSESSTPVLSANVLRQNTHFRLVLPRVACHQDIVVSFRLLSKLWRSPPVPTWSSPKPCCPVSPGP